MCSIKGKKAIVRNENLYVSQSLYRHLGDVESPPQSETKNSLFRRPSEIFVINL